MGRVGQVLAVCVVHQLLPDDGRIGVTGIDKRPVDGPVPVGEYGLRRDVQADRENHGGLEQAVYAYSQESADHWAGELGRDCPPGWFGENLRTQGLDLERARIGECWQVGDTLRVQVSAPRIPCATFARWTGEAQFVRRFTQAARPGVYLRVLRPGPVAAGDAVTVVSKPAHDVRIGPWFTRQDPDAARALRDGADAGDFVIGPGLAEYVDRALRRA